VELSQHHSIYQAKNNQIKVVETLIYRREAIQDVMQINVEMKCKLGLSYKKPLGSIDAMDARIMCQVSFIRLMLGTMCNMCFESNSRPSFANGLELAQYWKANQQCTLANYFKNYGLTCSPKIKTILMLLHEIHHILMCSLAHEKSI